MCTKLWLVLLKAMAQVVKNLPAMQETWVQSLGGEDPLEKGIATHFSILVWRISSMDRGQATVHGVAKIFKAWHLCTIIG